MLTPLMQRIKAQYDGRPAFTNAMRDVDKLGDRISVADRNVGQFTKSLMSTANIMRGGAFATAITASVYAVNNAAQSVADLAAEAETAGVSFEAFQELKFAAQEQRVGIEALTDGLKELNLRADEFIETKAGPAKEAFERLGYSSDELARKLVEPDRLFGEIIGRLGELETAAQLRVADEIFGGTAGEQFVRFINEGEDGIVAMRDRAQELGLVLRDDVGDAAEDVAKEFDLLMQRWDAWWKGSVLGTVGWLRDTTNPDSHPGISVNDLSEMSDADLIDRYGENGALAAKLALMNDQRANGPNMDLLDDFAFQFKTKDLGLGTAERDLQKFLGGIPSLPPVRPEGMETNGYEPPKSDRSDEISQFDKVIEALSFEAELIGKAQVEQDILNQIRRAGVDVMSDEADQIRKQVIANNELTAAVEAQAKAEADRQQQIDNMTGVAMTHFDELIAGTESLGEAIIGTIDDILIAALRMQAMQGFNQLFDFLMPGVSGGLPFDLFGARANGGHVAVGEPYLVGERGKELFVPDSQGVIIPNHRLGGGGGPLELKVNVVGAKGNREIMDMVHRGVSMALQEYDAGLNERVAKAQMENDIYRDS
ncbi:hypothetical protein [Maritalea myrionectae]|uniref:hypothetical protein n=1 Tax=Maritalea myrionectae TaxID=454601 RepID=UPI000418A32E|nr:hypothetical protein [Maritalea myrionectae]